VSDVSALAQLREAVADANKAVTSVLDAARRIHHDSTDAQIHALSLYGTIVELFSGCVALAEHGEPTSIPIVLRSLYEGLVDLDNLLHDASYVEHIQATTYKHSIDMLQSESLRELQQARSTEYDQLVNELARLKAKGKGPLKIRIRCEKAGRLEEYLGIYALLCLDTHNNGAALAERHLSEHPDGRVQISFFAPPDWQRVTRRLDLGLQLLMQASRMVHDSFRVPSLHLELLLSRLERSLAMRARAVPLFSMRATWRPGGLYPALWKVVADGEFRSD
jgi:hypothetical protein